MGNLTRLPFASMVLFAAGEALGQAVWTGSEGNQLYGDSLNWSPSSPANDGSAVPSLNFLPYGVSIDINLPVNLKGLTFNGTSGSGGYYYLYGNGESGNTLTLGSSGLSLSSGPYASVNLYSVPVVLSSSQTWNVGSTNSSGWIEVGSGLSEVGGPASLTVGPNTIFYVFGPVSISGGLTLDSGASLYLGSGGASTGTGTLTVDANAVISAYYQDVSLANSVTLGSSVTFYSQGQLPSMPTLTFTGPVNLTSSATTVNLGWQSTAIFNGALSAASPNAAIQVSGAGDKLINDGGSLLVVGGTLSNLSSVGVQNASLILAPSTLPSAAFSSVSPSGLVVGMPGGSTGYLGLDGSFTTAGQVQGFLSYFGASLGGSISGTLGFDSYFNASSPHVFVDPIDLSQFTSSSFVGLGSETTAILGTTAVITPFNNAYQFGGGGGTLQVQSPIADSTGPSSVNLNPGDEPLTLFLQGALTYTGGTNVNGGVLIFDTPPPAAGQIAVSNGYAGETELAAITANQFVSLFAPGPGSVIGFDSTNSSSPRTVSDDINLSQFATGYNPFIGTATGVTLTGTIEPAQGAYQFTGVKGATLTVSSQLVGAENQVVVGLPQPIEDNQSVSTVVVTNGSNSYGGGTVFNSGILQVGASGALGSGAVTVPALSYVANSPILEPMANSTLVTLPNAISFSAYPSYYTGGTTGFGLVVGNANTADTLVLSGTLSDNGTPGGQLAVQGSVVLSGANSYTGGTTLFTPSGSSTEPTLSVTNAASLGASTAPLFVVSSSTLLPAAANVTLPNPIQLSWYTTLTLGSSTTEGSLVLQGIISDSGYGSLVINSNVELDGANTFAGGTTVNNAIVTLGNATAFGTGPVTLNDAQLVVNTPAVTFNDLSSPDSNSSISLGSETVVTLSDDKNQWGYDFPGSLNGGASTQVVKTGPGTQWLSGTNTYGGGTLVSQGTLVGAGPSALGTGSIEVQNGAQLAVSGGNTISQPVTLDAGGQLGGIGTYSLPGLGAQGVVISSGDTLVPGLASGGNAVGVLTFTTPVTLGPGGSLLLALSDAGGTAGMGYSTVDVQGTLSITSNTDLPFVVRPETVDSYGNASPATFDPTLAYSWTLLTATGGITGFSQADFTIDPSLFENSLQGGSFSIGDTGNSLTLNFTPVPEPSTWAMLALGVAALGLLGIRRSRA